MEDEVRAGDLRRGFPLVRERDAQALEAERAFLREVDGRASVFGRWKGYWKLTGPGWLQSAITLGAGSAGSTILAGAAFGYKLLWVNPLAMFLGVVVFAAIGRQALLTHARPYDVFWKRLHPALVLGQLAQPRHDPGGLPGILSPPQQQKLPRKRCHARTEGSALECPSHPGHLGRGRRRHR